MGTGRDGDRGRDRGRGRSRSRCRGRGQSYGGVRQRLFIGREKRGIYAVGIFFAPARRHVANSYQR